MARFRTIKPTFWSDEKLSNVSHSARLLYIGLWNLSDDYGVVMGDPRYIHGQIFPYELAVEVGKLLLELAKSKRIVPFEHNGNSFFLIPTFNEHQKINRPSEIFRNVPAVIRDKIMNEIGMISDDIPIGKPAEPPKPPKPAFTPPDPLFIPVFEQWLDYKKSRRETYKSPQSLEQCYNKMIKLSNNDPAIAQEMIESSMASNYAGFFALKNNSYESKSLRLDKRRVDGVEHSAQSLR